MIAPKSQKALGPKVNVIRLPPVAENVNLSPRKNIIATDIPPSPTGTPLDDKEVADDDTVVEVVGDSALVNVVYVDDANDNVESDAETVESYADDSYGWVGNSMNEIETSFELGETIEYAEGDIAAETEIELLGNVF